MANVSHVSAPIGSVAVLRVVDFFLNVKSAIVELNDSRITRKQLSSLSDAQLEDIGLTRADVFTL